MRFTTALGLIYAVSISFVAVLVVRTLFGQRTPPELPEETTDDTDTAI